MKNKTMKLTMTVIAFFIFLMSINMNYAQKTSGCETYLKLTNTGEKFNNGLYKLKLEYFKSGRSQGFIYVISGLPSFQRFKPGNKSKMGSHEPLPEGRWYIHDIKWMKGLKDVYSGMSWGEGLGPVKIPLDYVPKNGTRRGAILIHLDWNASYSPGTEGCIGIRSVADFKKLVAWLRDTDPRDLYVDWGLGSMRK